MDKIFDGKRPTKLGTEKQPALVTVKTEKRKKEVEAIFEKSGWNCEITVDSKKDEDVSDLERLQNPILPTKIDTKVGRNDPCLCGSGKKYKKCCAK